MGQQGRLAHVYAMLIQQLWQQQPHQRHQQQQQQQQNKKHKPAKPVNPKSLRDMIAKCSNQFSGHEQHDAQELLSYLLSGLSEDLNRVVEKPYVEQPDSDGRLDR